MEVNLVNLVSHGGKSLNPSTHRLKPWGQYCSHPPTHQDHNLFMSDIPPHDMSSDFVIMAEQRQIEAEMAKKSEVRLSQGRRGATVLRYKCSRISRISYYFIYFILFCTFILFV